MTDYVVRSLTESRHLLSSALLGSSSIQALLRRQPPAHRPDNPNQTSKNKSNENVASTTAATTASAPADPWPSDATPMVLAAGRHAQTNLHRLVCSATAFPFCDPNASARMNSDTSQGQREDNSSTSKMLGVRIDVCANDGLFAPPYYLLLQRVGVESEKGGGEKEKGEGGSDRNQHRENRLLRIHRHTIPAFIPLRKLEQRFLPLPTPKGSAASGPVTQSLDGLVAAVRRALASWHLRTNAISFLRTQLLESADGAPARITDVSATALEARYVRLLWADGRIGRFRLSDNGLVECAVVTGRRADNGGGVHGGRDAVMEKVLVGGDGRVEGLAARLVQAGR